MNMAELDRQLGVVYCDDPLPVPPGDPQDLMYLFCTKFAGHEEYDRWHNCRLYTEYSWDRSVRPGFIATKREKL